MQSISNLLGKSKKQDLFQQAYIMTTIKKGLEKIQIENYPNLKTEFGNIQVFITPKAKNSFTIKLKVIDNSFKTFIKTEINNVDFLLLEILQSKGVTTPKFEIELK